MNKAELKTHLAKMSKAELETMVLNIHSQFPRVREFIYDTFHYSFVGNYANDCKKYMKKRKWLNDGVDAQFKEIVERYFESGSDGHKWILHFAEVQ